MGYSSRHVGRTKEALAEVLLRDVGIVADPYDLRSNYNRRIEDDQCIWSGFGYYASDETKLRRTLMSYSSMTECVKFGVANIGDGLFLQIEAGC